MNTMVINSIYKGSDSARMILGLPVDNVNLTDTIDSVFNMINDFKNDQRARLVASVNVDNLVMAHSWLPGMTPRHPEMLNILRSADLITADGMPIVWLSRLLGRNLKERVAGADLVPALCETAALKGASVFLLGGQLEVAEQAAENLRNSYNGLKVAGVASPMVHVEGVALDNDEADKKLVDEINASGADILFIGFGNPKQLVWFHRNRHQLKVPVSIGIGGTYDFIAGKVKRAPLWMQRSGMEWLFRLSQDPKRLWKRYFVDLMKFSFMTLPLLLNRSGHGGDKTVTKAKFALHELEAFNDKFIDSFTQGDKSFRVIALPKQADNLWFERNQAMLEYHAQQNNYLIFDFSQVELLGAQLVSYLVRILNQTPRQKVFGIRLTNSAVIRMLKVNRSYDAVIPYLYESMIELQKKIDDTNSFPGFYHFLDYDNDNLVVRLFGRLDYEQINSLDHEALFDSIAKHPAVFDLTHLEYVDSSGLVFFIRLKKFFEQANQHYCLTGVNDNLKQLFKVTRLLESFNLESSLKKAIKAIQ